MPCHNKGALQCGFTFFGSDCLFAASSASKMHQQASKARQQQQQQTNVPMLPNSIRFGHSFQPTADMLTLDARWDHWTMFNTDVSTAQRVLGLASSEEHSRWPAQEKQQQIKHTLGDGTKRQELAAVLAEIHQVCTWCRHCSHASHGMPAQGGACLACSCILQLDTSCSWCAVIITYGCNCVGCCSGEQYRRMPLPFLQHQPTRQIRSQGAARDCFLLSCRSFLSRAPSRASCRQGSQTALRPWVPT